MPKDFKLGKDALIVAVMTLVTTITWVGFDVYWAMKKTTIPKATAEQMAPLDPHLNQQTIDALQNNLNFAPESLVSPTASPASGEALNL